MLLIPPFLSYICRYGANNCQTAHFATVKARSLICHVLTSKSFQWFRTKKKFPNVVSMLQHSRKVMKTRKVHEHRGYARAICYLLGWDPKTSARDLFIRGCIPTPEEEQIDQEV